MTRSAHSETSQAAFVSTCCINRQDDNVYYFYEVYLDRAALEQHRAAPHYPVWREAAAEVLDGGTERTLCESVVRSDRAYWGKVSDSSAAG